MSQSPAKEPRPQPAGAPTRRPYQTPRVVSRPLFEREALTCATQCDESVPPICTAS